LADVENNLPATVRTRYRTASIAKAMTAVVVLSLMEEGRIDLDKEVQHYVPEFPKKNWPITTRQLLGHLAGIRHYKNSRESSSTQHFFQVKAALGTFRNDPLRHEPGTRFLYSSFGYNLLGAIAEDAGDKPFAELLKDTVDLGGQDLDLEEVLVLKPDLILTTTGRLDEAERFLQIAPTVFQDIEGPDKKHRWGETLRFYGYVLNLEQKANDLMAAYEARCKEFQTQMGERLDDLRPFNAAELIDALFSE